MKNFQFMLLLISLLLLAFISPSTASVNGTCEEDAECLHEGKCVDTVCECYIAFTGPYCEETAKCSENADCLNGGVCKIANGTCVCDPMFTGTLCEIEKNDGFTPYEAPDTDFWGNLGYMVLLVGGLVVIERLYSACKTVYLRRTGRLGFQQISGDGDDVELEGQPMNYNNNNNNSEGKRSERNQKRVAFSIDNDDELSDDDF